MHENERAVVGGVEYVTSISMAGSWYENGEGMERGVDGSLRGYRIVSVYGSRITHRYHSSCESHVDRQAEWCALEKPFVLGRAAALVLNCCDAPNGSTAQVRIDQGVWQPMPAFAAINEKQSLVMPHHFRLLADTNALGPGRHSMIACVRWPDGTIVTERGTFVFATSNRGLDPRSGSYRKLSCSTILASWESPATWQFGISMFSQSNLPEDPHFVDTASAVFGAVAGSEANAARGHIAGFLQ